MGLVQIDAGKKGVYTALLQLQVCHSYEKTCVLYFGSSLVLSV